MENTERSGGSRRNTRRDRKSTRLNSSHLVISYAVFCLKKKKQRIPLRLAPHAGAASSPRLDHTPPLRLAPSHHLSAHRPAHHASYTHPRVLTHQLASPG